MTVTGSRQAPPSRAAPVDPLSVAGALLGICAVVRGIGRLDSVWWSVALAPWAATLIVAGVEDWRTMRVPTGVVRTGGAATVVGFLAAVVATGHFAPAVLGAAASALAFVVLVACWKWAEVGFGDVRLATVGGLGLTAASTAGLAVGLAVAVAATVAFARSAGGPRFPLGPPLVAGFLVAVLF